MLYDMLFRSLLFHGMNLLYKKRNTHAWIYTPEKGQIPPKSLVAFMKQFSYTYITAAPAAVLFRTLPASIYLHETTAVYTLHIVQIDFIIIVKYKTWNHLEIICKCRLT
jgi:hypothetical protein